MREAAIVMLQWRIYQLLLRLSSELSGEPLLSEYYRNIYSLRVLKVLKVPVEWSSIFLYTAELACSRTIVIVPITTLKYRELTEG